MSILAIVVYLIVIALVWWVIVYALDNLPLPAPIPQFGRVIATIVVVVLVVMMLLQLVGGGGMPHFSLR